DDGIQEFTLRSDPDAPDKNFEENFWNVYESAGEVAIQSALTLELERTYGLLAKRFNSLDAQREETHRQYAEAKSVQRQAMSNVYLLASTVERLETGITRFTAASNMDKVSRDLRVWREKAEKGEETVSNMAVDKRARDKEVLDVMNTIRHQLAESSAYSKKAKSIEEQLKLKINESKGIRKSYGSVSRLLADISHGCIDALPDDIRARMNGMSIDKLLQITTSDGGDSDDDDAEAVYRLMSAEAGERKRGRGGQDSRGGRSQS
ncbi:hypothetical protein PENTCL1PPCAC_14104, partial [Pristionchus entomophagus]